MLRGLSFDQADVPLALLRGPVEDLAQHAEGNPLRTRKMPHGGRVALGDGHDRRGVVFHHVAVDGPLEGGLEQPLEGDQLVAKARRQADGLGLRGVYRGASLLPGAPRQRHAAPSSPGQFD